MQELGLQIEGKHEGECKKPGETSKAGYRNIAQFVCNEYVVGKLIHIIIFYYDHLIEL